MKERIAILTDSGTDVPKEVAQALNIYVLPLQVIYKAQSYLDGVSITAQEVYENLETEVPTTSLPKGESIQATLNEIHSKGYTHVLAIVLSSGLSGTYNLLRLMAQDSPIPMEVIDTKNIGVGSGLSVIKAAQWVKEGITYADLMHKLPQLLNQTKVYFVLDTLKYLQQGGRIGKVSALVGYALDLRPIITCNDEGIYTTVEKARGRKVSMLKCMETALSFLDNQEQVSIAISHGNAYDEALHLKKMIQERYPKAILYIGPVSPALGVHTGPGLIGFGVQKGV